MKKEYLSNLVCMLKNQLKEEEENYFRELNEEKSSFRLWQIKQRIKSLTKLLNAMETAEENVITTEMPVLSEIF